MFQGSFWSHWSDQGLLESIGYIAFEKWHGRGHRFDPDQVHQIFQQLSGTAKNSLVATW
jgi:hypothetical protein